MVRTRLTINLVKHACNNPFIHKDSLSMTIAKLVDKHAKVTYVSLPDKKRTEKSTEAPLLMADTRNGTYINGWGKGGLRQKNSATLGSITKVSLVMCCHQINDNPRLSFSTSSSPRLNGREQPTSTKGRGGGWRRRPVC